MSHQSHCIECDWSGTVPENALLSISFQWGIGEADELMLLTWSCPACLRTNEDLIREQDFQNGKGPV